MYKIIFAILLTSIRFNLFHLWRDNHFRALILIFMSQAITIVIINYRVVVLRILYDNLISHFVFNRYELPKELAMCSFF